MTDASETFESGHDLNRVTSFSDAVFAIAMTVLALSLGIPSHLRNDRVGAALSDSLPSLYAYFLSFVVIALFWLAHHRLFRRIVRIDPRMMLINLAMLSFVALLPFPTEVLGNYGDSSAAVIFYASTLVALGSLSTLLAVYADRAHLLAPGTPADFARLAALRGLSVPVVFAVSIPIAVFDPHAAELSWIAIVFVRFGLRRRYGSVYAGTSFGGGTGSR
ncbi:MAG TPA: TMEM175 family protein [Acidimicrobiia bacterium]|nr:TMEM175 family protein [Acidimicrobiia bacterium]